METLAYDNFKYIMDIITYEELVNLLVTCKFFFKNKTSEYYKKRTEKFFDPNEQFSIINVTNGKNLGFGRHDCDIYKDGIRIASIWYQEKNIEYVISITDELLLLLDYPKIANRIIFPDNVLKKIEYRFNELTIDEMESAYECPDIILALGHDDIRWPDIMHDRNAIIRQAKLLYYTLKYYQSEIKTKIQEEKFSLKNCICQYFGFLKLLYDNIKKAYKKRKINIFITNTKNDIALLDQLII